MLVDSHCHLSWFSKIGEVVGRAAAADVLKIVDCAARKEDLRKVLEAAAEFDSVSCCLGLHPEYIIEMRGKEISEAMGFIEKNIQRCAAIGEIGLDFKYGKTEAQQQKQEKYFMEFIELAKLHSKPVVVHSRYAERKALEILQGKRAERVLMHWFTNSSKLARKAVESGYFISVSPLALFDEQTQKVVESIPIENILLETDAPTQFTGEVSEPSWIPRVAAKVAELKGMELKEVGKITSKNAQAFFGFK